MHENTNLEFKSGFSNTFLKTVSAYANYGDGEILFGISDDGSVAGIDDPKELMQRIENSINDSLEPVPVYTLDIERHDGKEMVKLSVLKGTDTPYYASGKAYRRNHASTVKVDRAELNRLVLEGMRTSFEECPSSNQKLDFTTLDEALKDKLGLSDVGESVYITLRLYVPGKGFNNAGAVLADENLFPGIDIVKFGKSANEFMDRNTVAHVSALTLYDEALDMFDRYYKFEAVSGFEREANCLVPEVAYREAIANALVHREWDINGMIRVSFYDDRIEISSPGGLPDGVREEDYLAGRLSVLRNSIIADVFSRLGYIEKFGTGIPRIKAAYEGTGMAPRFIVTDGSITVVLPSMAAIERLDDAEKAILEFLGEYGPVKRSAIEDKMDIGKSKVSRILSRLKDRGLLEVEGMGRATKYKL